MSLIDSMTGMARAVKDYLLSSSEVPKTASYTTMLPLMIGANNWQQRPPFLLSTADLMCLDEQVWFATCVSLGPLMNGKVEAKGESKEVNAFVQRVWDELWQNHSQQFHRSRLYGRLGGEVVYEQRDGMIEFKEYLDRHPIDTAPLVKDGKAVGVSVRNIQDSQRGKVNLLRGRGLWLVNEPQFNALWGQSMYRIPYAPWWDKACPGGALDLRRLRFIKDAWIGDIFRYPSNGTVSFSDGRVLHARDVVREAADNRASGGSIVIPSDLWSTGEKMYDYVPPQAMNGQTQIGEWVKDLDDGIFKGMLIPKEVVEAASTGSGFSGRSIPLVSFLAMHDLSFRSYVKQIKEQVIDLLVWLNFGLPAVKQYRLEAVPLIETMGELMGPMGQPNTAASDGDNDGLAGEGGAGGGPAAPPAGPKLYAGSSQFSAASEFDESKVKRDEEGKFAEKGGGGGSRKSSLAPLWKKVKPKRGAAAVSMAPPEYRLHDMATVKAEAKGMDFFEFMDKHNGEQVNLDEGPEAAPKIYHEVVDLSDLAPTEYEDWQEMEEDDFNGGFVAGHVKHLSGGGRLPPPLIESSSKFGKSVMDGHHRTVSAILAGKKSIAVTHDASSIARVWAKANGSPKKAGELVKEYEAYRQARFPAEDAEPEFNLANDPPRPKKATFDSQERTAQKKLLDGMDALPGQMDLFSAAGRAPTPEGARWITIGGHEEGDKKHAGGFPVQISGDGTILRSGGPQGLVGKNVRKAYKHFQGLRAKKEAERAKAPPVEAGKSAPPSGETAKPQNKPAPAGAGENKGAVDPPSKHVPLADVRAKAKGSKFEDFIREHSAEGGQRIHHDEIALADLDPSEYDEWDEVDMPEKVAGMAEHLKGGGSLPAVLVRGTKDDKKLRSQVTDGHHRVKAAIDAGKKSVQVAYDDSTLADEWARANGSKENPSALLDAAKRVRDEELEKGRKKPEAKAPAAPAAPAAPSEDAEPEGDGDTSFDFGGGPAPAAKPEAEAPASDNPDMPKPAKKRMAPKDVIQFKAEGRENVAAAAREYGLDARELATVVHELWTEKRAALVEREKAKGEAKRALSVNSLGAKFNGTFNAKKASAWEDAGHDYSEWPGIDETAVLVANEYPELGLRVGPGVDTAAQLWSLVKEPYQEITDKSNKRLIDAAAEYLAFSKKNGDLDSLVVEGEDDGEPYQFSAATDFARDVSLSDSLRSRLGELLGDGDVWRDRDASRAGEK